jgi:hypothetical protein
MSEHDLSEFYVENERSKPGFRTWYEKIAPDMDPERKKALDAAMEAEDLTASAIAAVLRKWGYAVSHQQVGTYRRRFRG